MNFRSRSTNRMAPMDRSSHAFAHRLTQLAVAGVVSFVAIFGLASSGAGAVGAQIIRSTDHTFEIRYGPFFENAPPSGWIPLSITIQNGSSMDREWRVIFRTNLGRDDCLLGEWTLGVDAGTTREFGLQLPQPWLRTQGAYFQAVGTIIGPGVSENDNQLWVQRSYGPHNQSIFVGMSHRLAGENWSSLEETLNPGGGVASPPVAVPVPPPFSPIVLSGTRLDPTVIPADWRSFSGFAMLWLHREDWIALSLPHRIALFRWIAQGGQLYLAGGEIARGDLPTRLAPREGGPSGWATGQYGLGTITTLPVQREAISDGVGVPGRTSSTGPRLPIFEVAAEIRMASHANPALGSLVSDASTTIAETKVGRIRTGGVMLGLLVAAIAILLGPVNVLVLAPAKRRARLFITVPVIAVGSAAALVTLILVQDGVGGHGQRGALVLLMPDRPEALLLQEQCALTGLLLNREFQIPEDALLVDNSSDASNRRMYTGSGRPMRGGLNRRQTELSGNWFTSRNVQSHHLRQFIPTRASVTLERDADGAPVVISTCPAPLRDFVLVDANGDFWQTEVLPPGQRVTLARHGDELDDWAGGLREFGVSLGAAAQTIDFQPLTFFARADAWDETIPIPTLPSVRWRDDAIFVQGTARSSL